MLHPAFASTIRPALASVIRPALGSVIRPALGSVIPAKTGIHILLVSALLALTALACGAEPTATSVPEPTAMALPADTPIPATAQQPSEGHQPTAPAAATTTAAPADSSGAAPEPTDTPEESDTGSAVSSESPQEALELNVILATTVLEVGAQRVAFLLATPTGLVKGDTDVSITPVYLPDDTAGSSVNTRFHQWPYGVRGAFAAEIAFDRPGLWRLDINAEGPDGGSGTAEIEVLEGSPVPFIGSVGPLSENKTLGSVGAIELITTDYTPDLSLYEVTIREAVESPLPAVVVFASPAFCTTATCGPQVDAVSELRESYKGQAHFIHVEIYDNPDEIQGDLDRARIAPTVDEWGLTAIEHWFNESWTFVLGADGRVQDRFEGFATVAELEEALQAALN